jgi:RNA polymerase-binding transcription factor DksA
VLAEALFECDGWPIPDVRLEAIPTAERTAEEACQG